MPRGLYRLHESRQSHFITFSCYRRQPFFNSPHVYDLFPVCLERMRRHFQSRVYGYVVMPEHVHILLSEPERETLADAIHYLKLSFTKRLHAQVSAQQKGANLGHPETGSFWQKRYYDRNVRNAGEFDVKLRYLHRNPVKAGGPGIKSLTYGVPHVRPSFGLTWADEKLRSASQLVLGSYNL